MQACYDLPNNTLRLDSTHLDTYNLVGFSGCLHLWWISLLTPELLTPGLCVTSGTMNQFSLTTRLALNEFQASCYSHHRSQFALGETNWLLRVSGCNLTLNPYLLIQMGHHHGHPLTGAMELRPDHWSTTLRISPRDPKELCADTDQTFLINQTDSACIHRYIHIHHIQFLIIHLFRITITHWYQLFHVSCRTHAKLIISISCIISYNYHIHIMLKLTNHNSYTISFIKVIQSIILKVTPRQAHYQHLRSRKTPRLATLSPSFSLRQQGLAQARRTLAQASFPRLDESSTSSTVASHAFSLRRDSPRLSETFARSKRQRVA